MDHTEAILRRADDLITEKGWTKERSVDPLTGAICLGMAINCAAQFIEGRIAAAEAAVRAERVLLHIVNERGNRPRGFYGQIFMWNDEKDTTEEDVHLLVKEGIEAAAERSDR